MPDPTIPVEPDPTTEARTALAQAIEQGSDVHPDHLAALLDAHDTLQATVARLRTALELLLENAVDYYPGPDYTVISPTDRPAGIIVYAADVAAARSALNEDTEHG